MRFNSLIIALIAVLSASGSVTAAPLTMLTVTPRSGSEGFNISGSFVLPLTLCQAFDILPGRKAGDSYGV